MKNYSLLLLAFFFSGSLFAQSSLDTAHDEDWTITNNMNCNSSPLTPAQIAALTFSTSIHHVCAGIVSPTGDEKIGPTNTSCLEPDLETRVFRGTHTFTSKPCLVTYNFSADNAFRIYVNGISSPTNVLSGTPANPPNPGLCGNNYSGNDWHVAFPGTLNIDDFGVGNNNIDFETQNGTEVEGEHPYWLAGKLIFWQFSDLNASLFPQIDIAAGQIFVKYQFTPQTNGALYSMRVEYTNSFPSNQNWVTHFIKTGAPPSNSKFRQIFHQYLPAAILTALQLE